MANVLSMDRQIAVIGALAEGSSIRSIERITGIQSIAVLHVPPIDSPAAAVQAAIVKEVRDRAKS